MYNFEIRAIIVADYRIVILANCDSMIVGKSTNQSEGPGLAPPARGSGEEPSG